MEHIVWNFYFLLCVIKFINIIFKIILLMTNYVIKDVLFMSLIHSLIIISNDMPNKKAKHLVKNRSYN